MFNSQYFSCCWWYPASSVSTMVIIITTQYDTKVILSTSWLILVMSVFRNTSAGLKHLARRQSWQRSACIEVSCESNSWILRIARCIKSMPLSGTFNSAKLWVSRWHNSASAKQINKLGLNVLCCFSYNCLAVRSTEMTSHSCYWILCVIPKW